MDECNKFSKKNIFKKICLVEEGIIKCPVIITPLFFTPALKMDKGDYFYNIFFENILNKVKNLSLMTNYPFLTLVIFTPLQIKVG